MILLLELHNGMQLLLTMQTVRPLTMTGHAAILAVVV